MPNIPGATFIPGATSIPKSGVVPPLPECMTGCSKFIVGQKLIGERGVIPWQVSWRWGRGQSHL